MYIIKSEASGKRTPLIRGNFSTFTARPVLQREFPLLAYYHHDTRNRRGKFLASKILLFTGGRVASYQFGKVNR